MQIVTVLCVECSCYFRMEAFEPEDLKHPVCYDCAETAGRCPHDDVSVERYDAGRASDTGYRDAGEIITCRQCGHQEVA